MLSQQKNSIKEYVDLITKYSYKQQELNNQLNNNYEKQKSNKEDISVHNELREFLSKVSAEYRVGICNIFNNLLTEALTKIFEKNIKFQIQLENYRNQPAINVLITEDGNVLDPQKSCGGGMNDIISLVFKVIFVYLAKGQQTIVLDESLKFLSKEYLEQASAFLRQMCDKLDMQIILVSHKENLQFSADKVITIDKQRGKSLILS